MRAKPLRTNEKHLQNSWASEYKKKPISRYSLKRRKKTELKLLMELLCNRFCEQLKNNELWRICAFFLLPFVTAHEMRCGEDVTESSSRHEWRPWRHRSFERLLADCESLRISGFLSVTLVFVSFCSIEQLDLSRRKLHPCQYQQETCFSVTLFLIPSSSPD